MKRDHYRSTSRLLLSKDMRRFGWGMWSWTITRPARAAWTDARSDEYRVVDTMLYMASGQSLTRNGAIKAARTWYYRDALSRGYRVSTLITFANEDEIKDTSVWRRFTSALVVSVGVVFLFALFLSWQIARPWL